MELGRLWKLSIPEIKVYRRKTGTWSIRTQGFVKKTLRQEISTMERQLMEMTRAETRLSVMSSPDDATVTVLS